ncbi:patatin-like phospholipase family protein [Photobacterium sanguinicancri]|uniref:Patatin-like phospholipase family protein n=1 Tax=Photobacterium sanguinicancri TaxID=875932 RepID=A0AAW7YBG0_9GAMM|nr:patatin-like phospholipase family protein [Photobacterium sanguinicancri]MDO6544844.1 patatin-like phospholipase family protein [Photobacterium sanguinicancri]
MAKDKPKISLLLSGGGARAAYQVGVLKAISEWYPRVHHSPFSIYCGTSAGAINATSIACYASCFRLGVKKLEWIWGRLHSRRIFKSSPLGMTGYLAHQWYARMQAQHHERPPFGLLNNRPLRELLNQVHNYDRLEKQIMAGNLEGLSITASSYKSGLSVSFFQGQSHLSEWDRAKSKGRRAMLNTDHLMASAAIPLVFPASRIGRHYYGDGSIHQLAPLRPSLKMGADKILIINLINQKIEPSEHIQTPGLATLGGHLMDTIFSDTLTADLEHLDRTNRLLQTLPTTARENLNMKVVEHIHLFPSQSFEPLAQDNYCYLPPMTRALMRMIGISPQDDAAITSYILFEPGYIKSLIQLGYEDALRQEVELRNFLK